MAGWFYSLRWRWRLWRLRRVFERMAREGRGLDAASAALSVTFDAMRRDHPDWFDPETGYLKE